MREACAYWVKSSTMPLSAAPWFTIALRARGGQLDRRERVLDLVREAARDFAPGGVALRLDEVRDVVEHHHIAVLAALAQARAAKQKRALPVVAAVVHLLFP